ncbi:WYL domain-containing protein [Brevibacillus centrosporus]|uniref:WYL domain-containing protein n=1 Tax=Brevibacillus centrosporus TaxID=54910 RepID=UPI00380B080A
MLRELKRYLAADQLVDVIYLDRQGETSKRTLHLQSIEGGSIKAYCLSRRAPRVFKIDNILAIYPASVTKKEA